MNNEHCTELFFRYLKLSMPPLALKMCTCREELPSGVIIPGKEWGVDLRVCQAAQVALRYDVTIAVPRYEMPCPTGAVALGFYEPNQLYWSGDCLSPSFMTQGAKKRVAENTPKLEAGKYAFMLVAPFNNASFQPDLLIIYGNPGQITKLIQAAVLKTGEPLTAKTVGGTACSEWISEAMITGECQYVFPCDGERQFGALENGEMIFSLPYKMIGEILDGLERASIFKERTYPPVRFLLYQGPNTDRYEDLLESLRKKS